MRLWDDSRGTITLLQESCCCPEVQINTKNKKRMPKTIHSCRTGSSAILASDYKQEKDLAWLIQLRGEWAGREQLDELLGLLYTFFSDFSTTLAGM